MKAMTRDTGSDYGFLHTIAPSDFEGHLTRIFAWILQNTGFGEEYLERLRKRSHKVPGPTGEAPRWDTEVSFPREGGEAIRPAMVCRFRSGYSESGVIFAHTVCAPLRDGQIQEYRDSAPPELQGAPVVLICENPGQMSMDVDVEHFWWDVHTWLEAWLRSNRAGLSPEVGFVVRDLLEMMDRRGLSESSSGIPSRAHWTALYSARISASVHKLLRLVVHQWRLPHNVVEDWGRIGFMARGDFERTRGAVEDAPGVFVGILLPCQDCLTPERELEAVVMLWGDVLCDCTQPSAFHAFRIELLRRQGDLPEGWKIQEPWKAELERPWPPRGPRPWRLLELRRPLADVLSRVESGIRQAQRFHDQAREVVRVVEECLSSAGGSWDWRSDDEPPEVQEADAGFSVDESEDEEEPDVGF